MLLFAEACVLLAAATMSSNPAPLGWALVVLWSLDIVWVGGQHCFAGQPVTRWAFINLGAVLLTTLALLLHEPVGGNEHLLAVTILGVASARTGLDYWVERAFYFPSSETGRPLQ